MSDKECLEAEAAALQRFLKISPDAGLKQAIRLAQSDNSAQRDLATQLLGEIGTEEGPKHLKRLVNDTDGTVAADAKYALSRSTHGPLKFFADSFENVGSVSF